MKAQLKITLKSDTLLGTGTSLAGIIDSITAEDKYGIPYIPAKRIYGILRENAEMIRSIKQDDIDEMFGKSGMHNSSVFHLHNGYINDYEQLESYIKTKVKNTLLSPSNVRSAFTYERTATAIENDTAKENSLRTVSVLKKGLVFNLDAEFPDSYRETIDKVCKATRKIGSNRNRGYGECTIELIVNQQQNISNAAPNSYNEDTIIEMQVIVKLKSALIMEMDGKPLDYIPGSSLLGFFAGKYIKENNIKSAHKNSDFRDLFLNNNTVFTNAYPLIDKNRANPCPLSIRMLKNKEGFADLLHNETEEQLRGIPGNYYTMDSDNLIFVNPETELHYHHKRPADKSKGSPYEGNDDSSGSYFQYSMISSGQLYAFSIIGKNSLINKIKINKGMDLWLGKSRKTEYGHVEIVDVSISEVKGTSIKLKSNDELVLTLISDFVYSVENPIQYLIEELNKKFGIESKSFTVIKKILKIGDAGGHYGVWNLPKPKMHSMEKGSEIRLKYSGEDREIELDNSLYLGYRNAEGYGEVAINRVNYNNKTIVNNPSVTIQHSGIPKDFANHIIDIGIKAEAKKTALKEYGKTPNAGTIISKLLYIYSKAQNINDLDNSLAQMDTEKNIKHFQRLLILQKANNSYLIDQNRVVEKCKEIIGNSNELIEIMRDAGLDLNSYVNHNLFNIYNEYAENLLYAMQLNKRGGK